MAKYRITIETLEGEPFTGENSVELSGFCLFGDSIKEKDDDYDSTVIVHELSMMELASHIAADDSLMPTAIMATGMYEAYEVSKKMKRNKKLAGILGGLVNDD